MWKTDARFAPFAMAILAAAPAAPAAAQVQANPSAVAQARHARLTQALSALQRGDLAAATLTIDPLLAEYERLYLGEKRKIYCATSSAQALFYMSEAATAKRSAVAIDPDWCSALWAKGYLLADARQYADAIVYLQRAVAMAPSHSHYLSELGFSYVQTRQWQKALDAYSRASASVSLADEADRDREQGIAWRGMGYALIELGRWSEAEATFRKALALDPNDAKSKSELNYIAEHRKKQS